MSISELKPVSEGLRRFDVITGARRRRSFTAAEKASIVKESYADGVSACGVARRHGLTHQQLFGWRGLARHQLSRPADRSLFVPVIVSPEPEAPALSEPSTARKPRRRRRWTEGVGIEFAVSGVVVRVGRDVDTGDRGGDRRPARSATQPRVAEESSALSHARVPPVVPGFPRASEQTALALAERGLRASVVRLSRSTHGLGERHGFVPMLAAVARERGISAYVGDGQNHWPAVHRLDAARLFRLALERGGRNEAYHAVAEAVPFRLIAEAIGRQLGVPAEALAPEEAETHFGPLAMWVAGNGPASSEWTRGALGWEPRELGLIADIDRPGYYG